MGRRSAEELAALDGADPLGFARGRFVLPEGLVYLDGNSLGPVSAAVAPRLERLVASEWGVGLIGGWDDGWMELPLRLGDRIAPLIGAGPGEVIVCDTTSIALAKLVAAALGLRSDRRTVLTSGDNFPSDLFAAGEAARRAGGDLVTVGRDGVQAALSGEVALLCLTHVDFRTGEMFDLAALTAAAHEVGALVLFDLCHSAGAVEVELREHGVDLAVGCTYKYLNGGPGSPSFLYVCSELQESLSNPLPGWLGHAEPFAFGAGWQPANGIRRFLTSSPPVVSLTALDAALDAFDGLSMQAVRAKSVALTELFIETIDALAPPGISVASPRDPARRGSQVALRHPAAERLVALAAARGVVGDFRAPDLCRFGFAPLYLSFAEVDRAALTVAEAAAELAAG